MNLNIFKILFPVFLMLSFFSGVRGLSIIQDLLRNNLAGPATNFKVFSWPIDPDEGLRLRKEYVAENGLYGNKHVERIGLGEDGRQEERRIQQKLRDEMGLLSYEPPPLR